MDHLTKFEHQDKDSILHKRCQIYHEGRKVEFKMGIFGTFYSDTMKQQIRESVEIRMIQTKRLMNLRGE